MSQTKSVRITDPHICRLIAEEQQKRGDATAAKTAARIISEWRAQNDLMKGMANTGGSHAPASKSAQGDTAAGESIHSPTTSSPAQPEQSIQPSNRASGGGPVSE